MLIDETYSLSSLHSGASEADMMMVVYSFTSLLKESVSLAVQDDIPHSTFKKALTCSGQGVWRIITKFHLPLPLRLNSITICTIGDRIFSEVLRRPLMSLSSH